MRCKPTAEPCMSNCLHGSGHAFAFEVAVMPWELLSLTGCSHGGAGRKKLEKQVEELESKFPKKVKGVVKFSAPLAHQITAGGWPPPLELSNVKLRRRSPPPPPPPWFIPPVLDVFLGSLSAPGCATKPPPPPLPIYCIPSAFALGGSLGFSAPPCSANHCRCGRWTYPVVRSAAESHNVWLRVFAQEPDCFQCLHNGPL